LCPDWSSRRYSFNWREQAQNLKGDQPMSIANAVRDELKAAKKLRMPGWAVVCVIIVAFLCHQLFKHVGRLDLGLPILNSIGVLGFIIALKRRLWRHAWFWATMAVIAALHVPFILFVPWTTRWVPALVIAVLDSLGFCLILWTLAVVGRFVSGGQKAPKG
jgi:hypothetical protein